MIAPMETMLDIIPMVMNKTSRVRNKVGSSEDHQDNPEKDRKLVDSVSQGPKESTQHHIVDWGAGKPDFQVSRQANAQSEFSNLAMIG